MRDGRWGRRPSRVGGQGACVAGPWVTRSPCSMRQGSSDGKRQGIRSVYGRRGPNAGEGQVYLSPMARVRLLVLLLCIATVSEAQHAHGDAASPDARVTAGPGDLVIGRADGTETRLTQAALVALTATTVEVEDHGSHVRFTGVRVADLLRRAGAGPVDTLHAAALRRVLVAQGADGYRAVIALAELDPAIGDRGVFLVTAVDGAPLPAAMGPFRLVIVGDKRPTRWVRQLVRLEVRELP